MRKLLLFFSLVLLWHITVMQTVHAQPEDNYRTNIAHSKPVLSKGLHTLSIHVRNASTHDSIFHFLVDQLKLPVYYFPVGSNTKYAGVYAGNLVLEPCGPYINRFHYATNDFRAIFFGLTFEPFESIPQSAMGLTNRKILHKSGDSYIYLQKDSVLCGDNMTISLLDRETEKTSDKRIKDSLRYAMNAGAETTYKVFRVYDKGQASFETIDYYNELGIEYVKEIRIGYKSKSDLQKWKQLISPEKLTANKWKVSELLDFQFVKSEIKEVQSITFKVKSLEKARLYLLKNNLVGKCSANKIEIDKKQAFGLSISFTEEN